MRTDKHPTKSGISILTCTNNPRFIHNVFANYKHQVWRNKELIIIVNRDNMNLMPYKQKAKLYKNVSVYRLPETKSLGACLNYGVKQAKYDHIAKFDHDDYYAPYYVSRSMMALKRKGNDVVGKRTVYLYLESKKALYIRYPNRENTTYGLVAGGTIMFKKKVFKHVKFSNRSLGEDVKFLRDCKAKGYKVYSTDRYNYVYIRRKNPNSHTWKTKQSYLLRNSKIVAHTVNFKRLVRRSLKS